MELEGRPRPALMLKEWLELEFVAELSRGGFGCYPRHLVAELRGTRRSGDVIARVSAAVRDALFRPAGRAGEEVALSGNNSPKRLRMGFWKKLRGDEAVDRRVPSCSASSTTASCGRRDGPSPAKPPRRRGWGRAASGGVGAGAAGRRSHETEQEATRHLDQERERKQNLSPVSVMDFLSQDEDEDDDGDEDQNGNGGGGDNDETASPTFQRSIANIRRASDQLLQKIRQFEQLAELDISDVDDATTVTEDISCHMVETDSIEDSEGTPVQGLLDLLEQSSSTSTHCFQKLLTDFFRNEKVQKGEIRGKSALETARAWLDGQDYSLRPIWTVVKTEIEPLERWRCLSEHEQKLLAVDLEGDILSSLVGELIVELHHH